jgi:hypothetical protein
MCNDINDYGEDGTDDNAKETVRNTSQTFAWR